MARKSRVEKKARQKTTRVSRNRPAPTVQSQVREHLREKYARSSTYGKAPAPAPDAEGEPDLAYFIDVASCYPWFGPEK